MKNKNEQAERKADAPVEVVEKVEIHDNREIRWNALITNPYGRGLVGAFGGRPPMWHPEPNL